MTELNSEKDECCKDECCKCSCCKSKSSNLLLSFMLLVIIILLAGIFYSIQAMIAISPVMKGSQCHVLKGKMPFCPYSSKSAIQPAQ